MAGNGGVIGPTKDLNTPKTKVTSFNSSGTFNRSSCQSTTAPEILVVGGAGYVGGGIVDKLSQEHEVTVYDSLIYETSYRKKVNFILGEIE